MAPAVVTALGQASQRYLLEARQMQALSFTAHIPLVCFGIAFPAMFGIGTLLALLGVVHLWTRWRRGRLPEGRWFYLALAAAGPGGETAGQVAGA